MNTLTTLLDEGARFDPHYLPAMNADHLPMALVAIDELGGNAEQLRDFQKRYQARLRNVVGGPDIATVAEGRGRFEAFSGLRNLLREEITGQGSAAVLRQYLPDLLPSVAAGAFHPIIRLGFALKANHAGEIASALAYWLIQDLTPSPGSAQPGTLKACLQQSDPVPLESGRFDAALKQLVDADLYPPPVATSLAECAATSLEVYLGTRNFFALHFVTATQAARMCLPYVEESLLVASLSAAIRAGYLAVDAPDFARPLPVPEQLDEAHCIKYVYACGEEYQYYGDPRYREEMENFAAAGLVPHWVQIPA
jgi:hypothetical protein